MVKSDFVRILVIEDFGARSRVEHRAGTGARARGDLTLTRAQSDWTEFCLRLSASSIHVQTQKPAPVSPLYSEKKEAG